MFQPASFINSGNLNTNVSLAVCCLHCSNIEKFLFLLCSSCVRVKPSLSITPVRLCPVCPNLWCCGRSRTSASGLKNTVPTTTWPTSRPSPITPSQVLPAPACMQTAVAAASSVTEKWVYLIAILGSHTNLKMSSQQRGDNAATLWVKKLFRSKVDLLTEQCASILWSYKLFLQV